MPSKVRKNSVRTDGDGAEARLFGSAVQFIRYLRKWELQGGGWPILRSVTLYAPSQNRTGNWLVVGKAWAESGGVVAFHRSPVAITALVGFFQKFIQGTLVWRQDKPYESPFR